MKCSFIKSDGTRCNANAIKGSNLCINHNPEYAEIKSLAVIKGGTNRREPPTSFGEDIVVNNPDDIMKLLANTLNLVWTGQMSTNNVSGSIGFLCRIFLDAYDKAELEKRIEEIEKKLENYTIK